MAGAGGGRTAGEGRRRPPVRMRPAGRAVWGSRSARGLLLLKDWSAVPCPALLPVLCAACADHRTTGQFSLEGTLRAIEFQPSSVKCSIGI